MAFGNINLGNLASALSISGADPEYIEQLRQQQALRDAVVAGAAPSPLGRPVDMAITPEEVDGYARRPTIDSSGAIERGSVDVASRPAAAPQLRVAPQEIQAALQRTGSQYQLPAQPPARSLPDNPYAEPLLPEGTDRALELTGSQYRAQRPPMVDPQASTRELRARSGELVNDAIADEYKLGDVKADVHDRKAALYSDDAVSGQMRMEELQQRRDEAMTRKEANTKEAYSALRTMQDQLGSPPDTSKGRALQIIGAVLSMTKRGEGVGKGLAYLGQVMGDDVQKWARGVEGSDAIRKAFLEMNRYEDMGLESELQQEGYVSNLVAANTLNSLKAAEEEAGSEEAKVVARKLARGIEDQAIAHQLQIRDRLAASQQRTGEDRDIMRALADTPEEQRAELAARLGPRAVDLLDKMQKPMETQADILKKRADAAAGPKLSDGDRKLQRLAEGVRPAYNSLSKLAQRVGEGRADIPYVGIGPGATQWLADESTQGVNSDILQVANVLLRDETGANLPEHEQKTKWESWGLMSPDQKVRNRGLAKMLAEYEGRVAAVNPVGAPAQRPAGAGPTSGADVVMMISPTGREVPVPADKVEAAEANKYRRKPMSLSGVMTGRR